MRCRTVMYLYFFKIIVQVQCWQYYERIKDILLFASQPDQEITHSEYLFGNCKDRKDLLSFYTHVHLDHMDVLGKPIVRGWLDILRIPTCIILRATSYEQDTFRSTAYSFQMCVPRITYCHSRRRFKYFYYEWYIPADMYGGMNWDIYFYGPETLVWQ